MSKNKKLVPKRRFNRFEKDKQWFIEKLSSFAEFSKGNGYSKNDLCEQGLPILLYGRLYTQYETIIRSVDTFIINKKDSTVFSSGDEVVVPASGETAKDIARASFIHKSGIIIGGDLNIIKPKDKVISHFLAISLSSGDQKKELIKRAQGKTVVHLHNSDLKDIKFIFPTKKEQIQIGEFFKKLDTLIQTQQKKLEKTKTLKSAYLAEMFPCDGESKPKLRFKNFDKIWNITFLGLISQIKTGESDAQDSVAYGKYPFFVRSENIERSNRYLFDGEAILIPGEGRLGEIFHYINGKFDYHQRVYKISNFSNNIDGKFIFYLMQKNFKEHALKYTVKATVDSLRLPMLTNYRLKQPTLQEQNKVSSFFVKLDQKIALEQRKLEKLNNIKQAYLNEMFV